MARRINPNRRNSSYKTGAKPLLKDQKHFDYRVRTLAKKAATSPTELSELVRQSNSIARKANSRLLQLERAGRDKWAYEAAYNWLSSHTNKKTKVRFKMVSARTDIDYIKYQLYAMNRFLQAESSTVQGQEAIEERQYQGFINSQYIHSADGTNRFADLPEADVKNFLSMLGSSTDFREFIKKGYNERVTGDQGNQYGSGNFVDILRGAFFELNYSASYIQELFAQYQIFENSTSDNPEGISFSEMLDILKGYTTLEKVLGKG